MKAVKVYTTAYCIYCRRAKSLLKSLSIPFEEVAVDGDSESRAWLVQATGQRTVPQVFIGEESIGGFTELSMLERSGQLQDKLQD